jgi:4-hydroxybenzoate polyprenyltransferase
MRDLVTVHRMEYPLSVHYLGYAVLGACYAVDSAGGLLTLPAILAMLANLALVVSMNSLNTASDVDTDTRSGDKGYVSGAAVRLGRRRLLGLAAGEMTFALAVTAVLTGWTGRWYLVASAALVVVLHLLYNLEPVRLKRRGSANPVTLGISLGLLPCVVAYGTLRPGFEPSVWPILLAWAVLTTGRAWWWSLPDRAADAATGMGTPVVRHGAVRTLVVCAVLTGLGLGLLGWGLWWRYGPLWALAGVAISAGFLAYVLPLLPRRGRAGKVPNANRMRRRGMSLVVLANVVVALIPLVAE